MSNMKIVLSSRNKKKIAELRTIFDLSGLKGIELLSLNEIKVFDDTEENGMSFEENSLIKAAVPASRGYIGIADDSGLCVDALDGAPGIFSARYAGVESNDQLNNIKLLNDLRLSEFQDRSARFVCVVSCVIPARIGLNMEVPPEYDVSELFPDIVGDSKAFCVRGECPGFILDEPMGKNGFGYDPLFYIPEKHKTFAQLLPDEKNEISHRGNAMRKFVDVLKRII